MKVAYINYALSVIVGRALPDVRDGLKPVQRRILFAMQEMGVRHSSPHKKCARIVGDTMGKYHPHGDLAIYDALVRLAQGFNMRYPLIEGQGNFGSIDGDNPAAMRYTEARLAKIADEMLADIDKETVDFFDNYNAEFKEPMPLPAALPNLLVNGSAGIAVGMATNIPPHNLREVAAAAIALIDEPDLPPARLLELVPGPDFPTGGIIAGRQGILDAYATGRGRIVVRGVIGRETVKDRARLVVTEIPYQINKAQLVEQIADCVRDKRVEGIADLRDESDRHGMRIVIDLKGGANPDVVTNQLLANTRLQVTFSIMMLALVDNAPRILPLKDLLRHFIEFRHTIVRRRTEFDLRKAKERAHLLEGLIVALDNLDAVITLIRKAKAVQEAQEQLTAKYKLTPIQAGAILDMKLSRLTGLEREKIRAEQKETLAIIKDLESILASEAKVKSIIKAELGKLVKEYGDERRTQIADEEVVLDVEDLIKPEDVVVTLTHAGYAKRLSLETYKVQRRGGVGVIGATTKDEDFIERLFVANTHDTLLVFTSQGQVHWLKVYQLPEGGRTAQGKALVNLVALQPGELVRTVIPIKEFREDRFLVFATKGGVVKKTTLAAYARPRAGGIIALTLDEGDDVVDVAPTDGRQEIILATRDGNAVRFAEEDARPIGRASRGVRGITLEGGDAVVSMVIAKPGETLLTVTANGYGKRSPVDDYRLIARGGKGVINIKTSDRNGSVVAVLPVTDADDLIFISKDGQVIRMPARDISVIGRNTQGMRLMRLREGDTVVSAAKVAREADANGRA